jgi:hypothetical protein
VKGTHREPSIRPHIRRIDFDVTELERFPAQVASLESALRDARKGGGGERGGAPAPGDLPLADLEAALRDATRKCLEGRGDERELESLGAALARHPERRAAVARERASWDAAHAAAGAAALRRLRSVTPPWVASRGTSRRELERAGLPRALAARVFEERALWLARFPRRRVAKMALADLRRLNLHRLDLDELRGVYACLPPAFACDGDGAKAAWREAARDRLVSLARRNADGSPPPRDARHGAYGDLCGDGPFDPDEHDADDGIAAASPGDARRGRDAELAALSECRRASAPPSLPRAPRPRRQPKKLDAKDPRKSMLAALGPGLAAGLRKAPPPRDTAPPLVPGSPPPPVPGSPKGKTD